MTKLIIEGPNKLSGTIEISGAKNSVVALIPAAILCNDEAIIDNVPDITDTRALLEILNSLTTNDIRKVISDYGFILNMVKPNYPPRFSLKTATRYKRIVDVVKEIEYSTDTIIP